MEGWWGIAFCSHETEACHVNSQPKQLTLRIGLMKLKTLCFVQSSALNLFLVSEDKKSFCLHLPGGCGKLRWSCVIKLDERLVFYQWDMKSNQVKWVLRSQLISVGNISLHYAVTTPNSSRLICGFCSDEDLRLGSMGINHKGGWLTGVKMQYSEGRALLCFWR